MSITAVHPEHFVQSCSPGGIYEIAKPLRGGLWVQRAAEKRCRKNGGHWWHPDSGMIDWFCCSCGAERDGMPEDGT
jgi:hypothetical protein